MNEHRPILRVVSAEIQREGRYLITQRAEHAVLPLLWEFPGGRVRRGESDVGALARTLEQRLGIAIAVEARLLEVTHQYDDYDVVLAVYRCTIASGEPEARTVRALEWVEPERFGEYRFPGADQTTVELLLGDDT